MTQNALSRSSFARRSLLNAVGRSATLSERSNSDYFEPIEEQDPEVLAARERRWILSASKGDEDRFRSVLAERGMDSKFARDCVRDVRVRDPERLPSWASTLR